MTQRCGTTKETSMQNTDETSPGARPVAGARLAHVMMRVGDLERSLKFYTGALGMRLLRREDYPGGRFTLAFVGYGSEAAGAVIELTHNWDRRDYEHGSAYGHVAIRVHDVAAACEALARDGARIVRPAAPMSEASPDRADREIIAFIEDPDGYKIELLEG